MVKSSYEKYNNNKLILRDKLAVDRTILANERTFLAYIRTGFTIIIAGLTFFKFFQDFIFEIIGITLIPIGTIIIFVGLKRYFGIKLDLKSIS